MTRFQDLFSNHAACYARSRPTYPPELVAYLAGLVPEHRLAWDVGTGNGQAAIGLAVHFERVIATDASQQQIAHATPHKRIEYRVATAEDADLEAGSVDLVMIAQALHWFRHDAFYANVRRVARPRAVIAASCYALPHVDEPVDRVLDRFYHEVTGPYWEPQRRYVDEHLETCPFPFDEISSTPPRPDPDQSRDKNPSRHSDQGGDREGAVSAGEYKPLPDGRGSDRPRFHCRQTWALADYIRYLESWSAVQRFKKERGSNPIDEVSQELTSAWGDPSQSRLVIWPIYLRLGRIAGS